MKTLEKHFAVSSDQQTRSRQLHHGIGAENHGFMLPFDEIDRAVFLLSLTLNPVMSIV